MCYRFTLRTSGAEIAAHFGLAISDTAGLVPRYNVALSQSIPTLGLKKGTGGFGLAMMEWGFIPNWSPGADGNRPGNARGETIADKPMFRESFERRRCLIPADGFYEWETVSPKRKIAHHFRRKDGGLFAFAGIWDAWIEPSGKKRFTCCIVTTGPNDLLRRIHDRMPVMIDTADYANWLDRSASLETVGALLRPFPAERMDSIRVIPFVNNARHEGPECLKPLEPENGDLFASLHGEAVSASELGSESGAGSELDTERSEEHE